MKLLVFTPVYRPVIPEVKAAIESQLNGAEWVLGHENPFPAPDNRNVLAQYTKAWELAADYDALLTIEEDIWIPPNAIQELLEIEADVVYGVYQFRAWPLINAWRYTGPNEMGQSLTCFPEELALCRNWGTAVVSGVGLGCTLIRKPALLAATPRPGMNGNACDIPLAADWLKAGLKQMANFNVVCSHWTDDEGWVTPFGPVVLNSYIANRDAKVDAWSRTLLLMKNEKIELTPVEAKILLRHNVVREVAYG